jgi:hypothetical protein
MEPSRGRILGWNPDKSLKSLPSRYSQSPLQLRLEISIFYKLTKPLTVSTVQLLYTVNEKGGNPDRKPYPIPYGLINPYRNLKSENFQDYAQKPQQTVRSWIRLLVWHHLVWGYRHEEWRKPRRRITVTSSLNEISTDQLGNILWWWGEEDISPPTRHHPFLKKASGQIFKDDGNGFSSSSDICF